MNLDRASLEFLTSADGRRRLTAELPDDPLEAQTLLRKNLPAAQARAVMAVREVRAKAHAGRDAKFPHDWACGLLGTPPLLEQASSVRLAVYKGRSLNEISPGREVLDLCAGLGADAIGLAMAGLAVHAVDSSEAAVYCARHNLAVAKLAEKVRVTLGRAEEIDLAGVSAVHVDPDRRASGRRAVHWEDYSPDVGTLRRLVCDVPAGVMKLSPAMSPSLLTDWPVAAEWCSEFGVCKQLLAWWGAEVPVGARRATRLGGPHEEPAADSLVTDPSAVAARQDGPGVFLAEADPAVVAAGGVATLANSLGAWCLQDGPDWLFADEPTETPLVSWYRVLGECAGREATVRRMLATLDAGVVAVKPRGVRLDTDRLQQRLRGSGGRSVCAFWTKRGRGRYVILAERIAEEHA
jgi:hypothetical protein